jgi:hypothetical protein
MLLRSLFLSVFMLGGAMSAFSADIAPPTPTRPAVDGLNGKISFGGLYSDVNGGRSDTYFYGDGSFSAPQGERFGLQIDGAIAANSNVTTGGAGAHVFWRDPSFGLAGGYGEIISSNSGGPVIYRFGGEAEAYFDRFSVEAFAGVQDAATIKPIFTGDLTLAFYPVDNMRLSAGVVRNFNETSGVIGLEYGFQGTGTTLPVVFANAEFGKDTTTVKAGLRFYFGGSNKSLIQRHREDDPRNRLQFGSVSNASSAINVAPTPLTPQQQCIADGGNWVESDNFCALPLGID